MFCRTAVSVLFLSFSVGLSQAAEPEIWELWPGTPPGDSGDIGAEHDTTTPDGRMVAGRRVTRLTNVSKPLLSIYRPSPELDTGTAVIIAPGGGHRILAYDLEGTEVADWLNSIGVTGVLLKYRVPFRDPDKRWLAAAQDGQRAVSVVRARAGEIGVDPNKIGILGFSAGGTPVRYSALLGERLYESLQLQRSRYATDCLDGLKVHLVTHRCRRASLGDFLDYQTSRNHITAHAAMLLVHTQRPKTQLAQSVQRFPGKLRPRVILRRARCYLALSQVGDALFPLQLLACQVKVVHLRPLNLLLVSAQAD